MTNRQILLSMDPCAGGLARASKSPTLRAWWETSTTRGDMTWLVGQAHSRGTLSRQRLVCVAVRCVETVAHLMPPEALPHLATVSSWARGEDATMDEVREARETLREIRCDAADAALAADAAAASASAAAVAAAYAAFYDADALAAAAAFASAAAVAAAYAAFYDADAAADAADAAAVCDVIRDEITIDEVCAALGLEADKGVV